jgi:nucleoside-diphosphate-sugar epimerase
MARVVVIGGSGHIGTYLVPRLVEDGFEVVNVTRGKREPYQPSGAWKSVRTIVRDRDKAEKDGSFGKAIRDLKPDIVVDMICFLPESARQLVEALVGHVGHLVHVGTIWVHGPSVTVPAPETQPRRPFGDYGVRKAAIEALLLDASRRQNFPATVVHPGHIVGPGWNPLNPAGHFNPAVFSALAQGRELALPNFGLETVHHVHADDVAQMIMRAIGNWSASVGEAFHTVSPAAVTLRGYAEAVASWFGREAKLTFAPFEEWKKKQKPDEAQATWEHIARSPNASIEKARRLLGYEPRYTSFEGVREAVDWLVMKGIVKTGRSVASRA